MHTRVQQRLRGQRINRSLVNYENHLRNNHLTGIHGINLHLHGGIGMSDSRPTIKMYNMAVQSADNWRKNHDRVNAEATYWFNKFQQTYTRAPIFFLTGLMAGVVGTLVAGAMFSIH